MLCHTLDSNIRDAKFDIVRINGLQACLDHGTVREFYRPSEEQWIDPLKDPSESSPDFNWAHPLKDNSCFALSALLLDSNDLYLLKTDNITDTAAK